MIIISIIILLLSIFSDITDAGRGTRGAGRGARDAGRGARGAGTAEKTNYYAY